MSQIETPPPVVETSAPKTRQLTKKVKRGLLVGAFVGSNAATAYFTYKSMTVAGAKTVAEMAETLATS